MEDVSNIVAREGGHTQCLLGIEKKPSKMEDDECNDIDFRAKATIILCLSEVVLYNAMNKETTTGLWSRLKSLYMMKSFSNKLFMKKQLYILRMKKGKPILQHLNTFNRILCNLLALEVKIEEEDKALCYSLLFHQVMNTS